jgi:hypothetical protein
MTARRVAWRKVEGGEAAPAGASGDGGFWVVPELMSMVGCSGEEFASILKALGFQRGRRKLMAEPSTAEAPAVVVEGEAVKSEAAEAAQPEIEAFEEIWRPGKRKDVRHANRAGDQPKREHRPQGGKREREGEPLQKRPQMLDAGFDVGRRVEGIRDGILPRRVGHQLHQAHGALWRARPFLVAGLDLDHRLDDACVDPLLRRGVCGSVAFGPAPAARCPRARPGPDD